MQTVTWRLKCDRRAQPRTSPHDGARTTPEDGDIVVREEQREGMPVYVLHTAPGAVHVLQSRAAAVGHALLSAKRHGVRAWLTGEGNDSALLEDFRKVTRVEEDVVSRLRAEFSEMPGLRLKPEQVARLCRVERQVCQRVLNALVDEKFLCMSDGHYARLTSGSHPNRAKTDRKPTVGPRHPDVECSGLEQP